MTVEEIEWYVKKFQVEKYGIEMPEHDDAYVSIFLKNYNMCLYYKY